MVLKVLPLVASTRAVDVELLDGQVVMGRTPWKGRVRRAYSADSCNWKSM
jgi:translation initiation factor IF-1